MKKLFLIFLSIAIILPLYADGEAGEKFSFWTTNAGGSFYDIDENPTIYANPAVFFMPETDVTVTPVFEQIAKVRLTVEGGYGSGEYESGERVLISADPRQGVNGVYTGRFDRWTIVEGGGAFEKETSGATVFTMSDTDAVVKANYIKFYVLTVINGSGSGRYNTGEKANITADKPSAGQVFLRWVTDNGGVFVNTASADTVFTMPQGNTTVRATYANAPARATEPGQAETDGAGEDDGEPEFGESAKAEPRLPDNKPEAPAVLNHLSYVCGMGDALFMPEKNMTRAEAAQMLYGLLENKNVPVNKKFADVPDDAWYAKAVGALASMQVITGFPDGGFKPGSNITRAEFVTMLTRFMDAPVSAQTARFDDVAAGHWASAFIEAAAAKGWVMGYGDGTFKPDDEITRAEAVTATNKAVGRFPDKAFIDNHPQLLRFTDVPVSHWAFYEIMEAYHSHKYTADGRFENWMDVIK